MVSLVVVAFFLMMMASSYFGIVAKDWAREKGVSYANPSFLAGAENLEAQAMAKKVAESKVPPVDLSDIDPLAPRYKEWEERAAKIAVTEVKRAESLPLGGDKWGRDVLQKVVKGSEVSIFVGITAALFATALGTMLGAAAGYWGGWVNDFLEWFYNVFTSIPYILLILAFAAVAAATGKFGKGILPIVLILGLTGWTGLLPPHPRGVHQARQPRVREGGAGDRRLEFLAHVRAHPAQREPRGPGAALAAHGAVHQGRGDPVVPRFRRAGGHGLVGHDARRGAERARDRQVVAALRRRRRDGDPRHRLLPPHRFPARRAGSETQVSAQMTEPNQDLLLQVRDLDVRFRVDRKHEPFRAVKGISFDIPRNSTVALVGESGSGKSVSAMSILGLLPENAIVAPTSQAIYHAAGGAAAGRDLLKADLAEMQALRGKDISVIFQEPMTSLNPVFTVGEQIAESLRLHMGMTGKQAEARVIELLTEVGIPDPQLRAKSYPHEMSGGQQQRVMIAMAIACEPKLLIADEPTTALDVTIQKQILDLIASLQEKHQMSVLFITHDLGVVGDIADYVVVMQNGEIQEQGSVRQIFERPQHPYTKALLACRPRLDRRPKRLPVIDDFMKGDGHPHLEERSRGLSPEDPIILR
jgi:ABC-type dipeptide/oligopeptide/nickel transport system ATPase component